MIADLKQMADQQATSPDDLRRETRTALQSRRMDSVTKACKVVLGLATISGAAAVSANLLGMFSVGWLVALGLITIAGGAWAYHLNELDRLTHRSELLRELLQSEKYYENMLRSANEGQRVAEQTARELQTRLDVVVSIRELLATEMKALAAVSQQVRKQLPPDTGDQNG